MKKILLFVIGILVVFSTYAGMLQDNVSNLPPCRGTDLTSWSNCFGTHVFEGGDKYVGEFKFAKYHGQGTVTFANGNIYIGTFKDGEFHGKGTYTSVKGKLYDGKWEEGKKCGEGIFYAANGDRYVGEFKDDKFNGRGAYYYLADSEIKGETYVGEFKDGSPNGKGVQTYADGRNSGERLFKNGKIVFADSNLPPCPKIDYSKNVHLGIDGRTGKWQNCFGRYKAELNDVYKGDVMEGEWRNGSLNGHGTYYFLADNEFKGNKYVGEFKDGVTNGQGTYTFENGNNYVGEWKDGKMNGQGTFIYANGNKYVGDWKDGKKNRQGTFTWADGEKYDGEYKDGKQHGQGTYTRANGTGFTGEWADGLPNGRGVETYADGRPASEGLFDQGKFVRAEKINLPNQQTDLALNEERRRLEADRQALAEDRRRLDEEKRNREQAKQSSKLSLQATTTSPDPNGTVVITVRTNTDTSSLKVNGNEEGSKVDGNYTIKRISRVSQDTEYTIVATDVFGNTASTTITVARQAVSQSSNQSVFLKPENIKRGPTRDAVAIIIGIQNYKRVPKAEFANNDAKEFYEYAIRGLGIKPENIKLLVDEDADEVELYKVFQNWLPLQVTKNQTDVYVFYSGHGLPAPDGKSLYFLPHGVDKQFIEKTAVSQQEVIAALVASKPKSVTMFIDACYSGQTRSGEMMIASVRPLSVKSEASVYPLNFTVITASANDQYSSSSPELKHGIFSFYLMKGMEGDADGNKDGKITAGEMQEYLSDKVSRQAMSINRKQDTQLVGDPSRVLVGQR